MAGGREAAAASGSSVLASDAKRASNVQYLELWTRQTKNVHWTSQKLDRRHSTHTWVYIENMYPELMYSDLITDNTRSGVTTSTDEPMSLMRQTLPARRADSTNN